MTSTIYFCRLHEQRIEEASEARGAGEWEAVNEKHVGVGQLGLRRVDGLERTVGGCGVMQRHTPHDAASADERRNKGVERQRLAGLVKGCREEKREKV